MSSRTSRYLGVTVHTPPGTSATVHLQLYTFRAEHRDIAYERALQFGHETCFGRKFEGLAHLGETDKRMVRVWREECGEADDFVVSKDDLDLYAEDGSKPSCDAALLEQSMAEPRFQMQLAQLDRIDWYRLEHAYGNAFDVPKEMRRLTSIDPDVQVAALERLYGTIYHQGSIFPATVWAIDPLLKILANSSISHRGRIAELVVDITESALVTAEKIKQKWVQLVALGNPLGDRSEQEIRERLEVRHEIEAHFAEVSDLALDSDPSVAASFRRVAELVSPTRMR